MAMAIGDGGAGSCRRWRRSERPTVVAGAGRHRNDSSRCEKVRLARAAVAQGSGCGARVAKSGSVKARACRVSWLVQAVAVATATGGYAGGGRR